jgi:DNA-directed RNA polymerase specialized sigma24 family protein
LTRCVTTGPDGREFLIDLLAASRQFALTRPMLFEVMTSRPFAEFSPGEDDAEAGVAIYRMIVGAVRRWLRQAGSAYDAREAAHIIVAAHRGFVMSELAGLAGSSPRTIESRYRHGVDAVLAGILCASEHVDDRSTEMKRRNRS